MRIFKLSTKLIAAVFLSVAIISSCASKNKIVEKTTTAKEVKVQLSCVAFYNLENLFDTIDNENVNDDIVFEMELIKQVEINIDYILALIKKYHEGHLKDKEIVISISKAIDSSVELRNKKELIEQFIDSLTPSTNVDDDWHSFVDAKKVEELDQIINDENLDKEETYKFITNAFRDGYVQSTGTALSKVLPPVSRFTPTGDRTKKRESVLEKLSSFFNKFWDISGGRFLKN